MKKIKFKSNGVKAVRTRMPAGIKSGNSFKKETSSFIKSDTVISA